MWPGTSYTPWLWLPAPLSTGQRYLCLIPVTNAGAVPGRRGWGPSQATCFSSADWVDTQTYAASFSTSSTNILQFLYPHTSWAEFLLFTNCDQSSQGKFTAVCFWQWVVLLVPFWTPAGCIDHISAQQKKTQTHSIAVLVLKGAAQIFSRREPPGSLQITALTTAAGHPTGSGTSLPLPLSREDLGNATRADFQTRWSISKVTKETELICN